VAANFKWKVIIIIVVVASCLWLMYPPQERINLGLDLQGGMHLVLKVNTDELPKEARSGAVRRALEIIRNRVDQFGVAEPSIQLKGKNSIIVELPGIEDRQRAVDLIGRTALLEFKVVAPWQKTESALRVIDNKNGILEDVEIRKDQTREGAIFRNIVFPESKKEKIREIINDASIKNLTPKGYEFSISRQMKSQDNAYRQLYLLKSKPEITGESLLTANWDRDQFKKYYVSLDFDARGRKKIRQLTGQAAKKYDDEGLVSRLAVVLDNVVYSAPLMKVEVDTNPIIEGNFSKNEVEDLSLVLRAGSLPAPIIIEQENTVGPTLGQDSINKGVTAALFGCILVLAFMAIYYLFAGLIADFALCLNIVIILGALSFRNATLTLPGIAGIILTIGMAVDANVLIFERIREELKTGKSIRPAIEAGYHKVFSTILDANLTTLLTAFILYQIGTGPIKGFGLTLIIGITASMFTALVVTRVIFDFLTIKTRILKKLPMLEILRQSKLDIIGKRKIAYVVSFLIIIIGLTFFMQRGADNFGIDFTGGTIQQIQFKNPPDVNEVRNALKEVDLEKATIQRFGEEDTFVIRTEGQSSSKITQAINENFKENQGQVMRVEEIGPTVGKELRYKAIIAIVLAIVAICIYITFRFEFKFGICAIIALLHDVLITLGIYSLLGRELSLPIIAAILTIIGYSLNDTIVVFDRIREDLHLMHKASFKNIVNRSINETLSRTIITSLTTMLVVLCLYLFGGSVINDFALVLLIGVIVGTYSSIFVAAPILVEWHKKGK
jgi:SecD/SecF fusion protein